MIPSISNRVKPRPRLFLFTILRVIKTGKEAKGKSKPVIYRIFNTFMKSDLYIKFTCVIFSLYTIIWLSMFYARFIYPYTPSIFGGGLNPKIKIITKSEEVIGRIFYTSENQIFVLLDNQELKILNMDSIKEIDKIHKY